MLLTINDNMIPKWLSTLPNNIKVVLVILIGLHVFAIVFIILMYVYLFYYNFIVITYYIITIIRYQRATSKKSFQPFKAKLK